jgi:probable O-glycosylation ligase (exosortase A-associated)
VNRNTQTLGVPSGIQPNVTAQETAADTAKTGPWPFRLTLLYFIFEYGRPMDLFPILGRARLMMILSILLAVVFVLSGNKRAVRSRVTTWFALFLAWVGLHGLFSLNDYWAFYMFRGLVQFFVVYLCIMSFVDSPSRLRKFHTCILIVSLLLAAQGIYKHGRVGSFFLGDENDFCLAMNMLLPFSFFGLFEKEKPKRKLLCLVTLGVCTGAVVYSFSRGGFVGLLAVGACCWWKSPRKGLGTFGVALVVVALLLFAGTEYWSEMKTITDKEDSTRTGRLDSWKAGTRIVFDHPLGVGAGSYPFAVGGYDYELREKDLTLAGRAAHSLYFTLLPELGLPGAVFFFGMVIAAVRASHRTAKGARNFDSPPKAALQTLSLASMCGFVGFLVSGLFISVLYYPHAYYLAALAAVSARLSEANASEPNHTARRKTGDVENKTASSSLHSLGP